MTTVTPLTVSPPDFQVIQPGFIVDLAKSGNFVFNDTNITLDVLGYHGFGSFTPSSDWSTLLNGGLIPQGPQPSDAGSNFSYQITGAASIPPAGLGLSLVNIQGQFVPTDTGGTVAGIQIDTLVPSTSSNNLDSHYGIIALASHNAPVGAGTLRQLVGMFTFTTNQGAAPITQMRAFSLNCTHAGSGLVGEISGAYTQCNIENNASSTNMYGLHVNTNIVQSGCTLTNNYGILIEDQSNLGLGTVSATYNLYSKGSTALNTFEGPIEEKQFLQLDGLTADPAVAPANTARIYYNSMTNKIRVSKNTGAYVDLI